MNVDQTADFVISGSRDPRPALTVSYLGLFASFVLFRFVSISFISLCYAWGSSTSHIGVVERLRHWARIKAWAMLIKSPVRLAPVPLPLPSPCSTQFESIEIRYKNLAFKIAKCSQSTEQFCIVCHSPCPGPTLWPTHCCCRALPLPLSLSLSLVKQREHFGMLLFVYTDCCCRFCCCCWLCLCCCLAFDPQKHTQP